MFTSAKERFFTLYPDLKLPWTNPSQHANGGWPVLDQCLSVSAIHYIDFALAKQMLKKEEQSEPLAALICHLSMIAREGHCCTYIKDNLIYPSVREIWQTSDELSGQVDRLICQAVNQAMPLAIVQDEDRYYLQKFYAQESALIRHLKEFLKHPKIDSDPLTHAIPASGMVPEQIQAIVRGCRHPFTVITGGPGTGKTYTAGALLRTIWLNLSPQERASYKIALTAPTGKAAGNLEQSIQRQVSDISDFPQVGAKTLHSLLQIKKHNFSKTPHCLDADVLIVDECSMIDIQLMVRLLESIHPNTKVILLGDPNQLPSIDAGSVFSELVQFLKSSDFHPYLTELKTCLRSELLDIIHLANFVNQGNEKEAFALLGIETAETPERLPEPKTCSQTCEKTVKFVPLHSSKKGKVTPEDIVEYALPFFPHFDNFPDNPLKILELYSQFRILTPMRKGPFGTDHLNHLFFSRTIKQSGLRKFYTIPIMITSNHRRLNLFNGEMGLLIKYNDSTTPDTALFPSKEPDKNLREIPVVQLPSFEYAYCVSVHKSQGSEFPKVLLLLPEGAEGFGREALYTGITRAKRQLEIWSLPSTLRSMVTKKQSRLSGISQRLGEELYTNNFKALEFCKNQHP